MWFFLGLTGMFRLEENMLMLRPGRTIHILRNVGKCSDTYEILRKSELQVKKQFYNRPKRFFQIPS